MVSPKDLVVLFDAIEKDDKKFVGQKAVDLAQLLSHHIPIYDGFVITKYAFNYFLSENRISHHIQKLLKTINYHSHDSITQVSLHIQKLILNADMPEKLALSIIEHYRILKLDTPSAQAVTITPSHLHQFGFPSHLLYIPSSEIILSKIKKIYSLFFDAHLLSKRHFRNEEDIESSLIIQNYLEPQLSGVMYTRSQDKNKVIIEAVHGSLTHDIQENEKPDHYEIEKSTYEITQKLTYPQKTLVKKSNGQLNILEVDEALHKASKLYDDEIKQLAHVAVIIEKEFYHPQKILWEIVDNKLFIINTRQYFVEYKKETIKRTEHVFIKESSLKGIPVSAGIATGILKVITHPSDLKHIQHSDIVVMSQVDFEHAYFLKKAVGLVVESSDQLLYAKHFAQDFGIPTIIGVKGATKLLKTGLAATIDGRKGTIDFNKAKLDHPTRKRYATTQLYKEKIFAILQSEGEVRLLKDLHIDGAFVDYNFENSAENIRELCISEYPYPVFAKMPYVAIRNNKIDIESESYKECIQKAKVIESLRSASIKNIHVVLPEFNSSEAFSVYKQLLSKYRIDMNTTQLYLLSDIYIEVDQIELLAVSGVKGIVFRIDSLISSIYQNEADILKFITNRIATVYQMCKQFALDVIVYDETGKILLQVIDFLKQNRIEKITTSANLITVLQEKLTDFSKTSTI